MKKFAHINDLFVVPIAVIGLLTIPAQPSPAPPASPTPSPSPSPSPTPTPSATPQPCVYPVTTGLVITTGGKNYAVGDMLRAIGGTSCIENYPFTLRVDTVNANGAVTAVTKIALDSNGYATTSIPPNPIAFGGSATGTGFTATGVSFVTPTPTP
jgi:hypothetical protein